jgi:hypothetical protein
MRSTTRWLAFGAALIALVACVFVFVHYRAGKGEGISEALPEKLGAVSKTEVADPRAADEALESPRIEVFAPSEAPIPAADLPSTAATQATPQPGQVVSMEVLEQFEARLRRTLEKKTQDPAMDALSLSSLSIIALLEESGRFETVDASVSVSARFPGECRMTNGDRVFRFGENEFPEYTRLKELTEHTPEILMVDGVPTRQQRELPPDLVDAVQARYALALQAAAHSAR